MPLVKKNELQFPENVRPYHFHGLELDTRHLTRDNIPAECPFCSRDNKFNVKSDTGQYRCVVCNEQGNIYTFLEWLINESLASTTDDDYEELAQDRHLSVRVLNKWKLCKSVITHRWLLPCYRDGKIKNVYQYFTFSDRSKWLLTPTLGHQLFGGHLIDEKKEQVYLCEGLWDALALYETLEQVKQVGDRYELTSNLSRSLIAQANVLAIPSATVFPASWCDLFTGKHVILMGQNDHPRVNVVTKKPIMPASLDGMQRIASMIESSRTDVLTFGGVDGAGYDKALPTGYDVRDILTKGLNPSLKRQISRLSAFRELMGMISLRSEKPLVRSDLGLKSDKQKNKKISLISCFEYTAMISAWKQAFHWTDGLDHALATMLASILSTRCVGEQLWIKVIGPASCGKSTLCEAISTNDRYVIAKSTIRGFHSGWREDSGNGKNGKKTKHVEDRPTKDCSLLALADGKTLVTKDGDTLLQSPNLSQILCEGRDIFDGVSRSHYRNDAGKDYNGVRMTWILAGTSSLRSIDSSELGERFLDCVIMESIDDQLEDDILWRIANRVDKSMSANGDDSPTIYEPELEQAMGMTGGYVQYLCENANDLINRITISKEYLYKCTRLGKFTAYMRARPSERQKESYEREMAGRLVSQMTRLAKCLSVVLNKTQVDDEVMRRVERIALDTSRGHVLTIVQRLDREAEGLEAQSIDLLLHQPSGVVRKLLRFLKLIGVVEVNVVRTGETGSMTQRTKFCLTKTLKQLFHDAVSIV